MYDTWAHLIQIMIYVKIFRATSTRIEFFGCINENKANKKISIYDVIALNVICSNKEV